MFDHHTLKIVHLGCVALSLAGFAARGGLMLAGSALIWNRWVRTLPHLVDTALLASGLWLAIDLHQYPGSSPWLTAKLLALLAYVALGVVALRRGRTFRVRAAALVGALATFGYMVAVAVTRSPWPGLA